MFTRGIFAQLPRGTYHHGMTTENPLPLAHAYSHPPSAPRPPTYSGTLQGLRRTRLRFYPPWQYRFSAERASAERLIERQFTLLSGPILNQLSECPCDDTRPPIGEMPIIFQK